MTFCRKPVDAQRVNNGLILLAAVQNLGGRLGFLLWTNGCQSLRVSFREFAEGTLILEHVL